MASDDDIEAAQPDWLASFMTREQLPSFARAGIEKHFARLASWLERRCRNKVPLLLGINGAQGTGKSTLARYLHEALQRRGLRVVVLSLDDFYLPHEARLQLAETVHPLLAVRGVPGTHDIAALQDCLGSLQAAADGAVVTWPAFDKSRDDRASHRHQFAGTAAVILLEGWCVGTPAEENERLEVPLNSLEANADPDGSWRHYVNARLAADYAELFCRLDALCFLRVPDFDLVREWRGMQEQQLQARTGGGMNDSELDAFVLYFERVTRIALRELPALADCVLEFDAEHCCIACNFKT